ncbi:hypothetical protein C8C94_4889 [Acidovorax sp. 94]|nr:hypothetical protein C8C94_4889 [Acidovorax sp. 94]
MGAVCLVCGRRPGSAPGSAVTFFRVAERKSPKKERPPVCDPFALRRGNLRRGGCGVRRGTRFALARAARTTTASQLTKHGRFDAHAHPATAPPQAQPAGGWAPEHPTAEQPHGPLLRSASRSRREAPARCGPSAAQRSNGPSGCPLPGFPSGCAEERSGQRIRARDCLSAVKRSEFERDPAGREYRRFPHTPARACGDAACRVAFSLVTFSWRGKRKLLRRRAHTPASALQPGMRQIQCTSPGFVKLSPNGQLNRSDPDKLSPNSR